MKRGARSRAVGAVDHFEVVEWVAGGTKEKNVLRDPATGDVYIAKLGGRNSDIEVATEYLIFLAGKAMGASVAEARLATYRGRLRFLSRSFIKDEAAEELVHGYQLFKEFIPEEELKKIEKDRRGEQEMFTVQSVFDAFGAHYLESAQELEGRFLEMLTHDAILGLVDRHPENWGVVANRLRTGDPPTFAPLYDSAAGLFGERKETHLRDSFTGGGYERNIEKYIHKGSLPLIGWRGETKVLNHFELLQRCFWTYPMHRRRILRLLEDFDRQEFFANARMLLGICSGFRIDLVRCCISRRIRAARIAIGREPIPSV